MVIILAGILSGVFTATESAATAVFWALFITTLVYRSLSWPHFLKACAKACKTTGVVLLLIGIMLLINCALGLNTPPVGTVQFVGCAIGGISVGEVMKSILPFYGALVATMMLVTYVPAFSLWLPSLFK